MRWIVLAGACTPTSPAGDGTDEPAAREADPAAVHAAPAVVDPPQASAATPAATTPAKPNGRCVTAPFPEVRGPPDSGSTMTVTHAPRRFGTVVCAADREVWIDPKGRLDVCTIAKPTTVHGLSLAGDNYTHFHPDGRPEQTTLAREHALPSPDGTLISCAADHATFDRDGQLETCVLAKTTSFGKIECAAGEGVALRPDGALWACVVVGSLALMDTTITGGTRVSFHPGGAIESVYFRDDVVLDGIPVQGDVELHPNGAFAHYTLAGPRAIAGIELDARARARVWFYEDSSPWHLEYIVDDGTMIHGEPWRDTRRVTFDCAGKIVADDTEHFVAPTRPRPHR